MIIVKIIGGLGNQFFQYALGRRLSLLHAVPLKLDISGFETYGLHGYSLPHFLLEGDIASGEEIQYFRRYSAAQQRIMDIVERCKPYSMRRYIKELYYHYNPRILGASSHVYLEGYWQSEKYFMDIESTIRDEFQVKYPLMGQNKELADQISSVHAISLHVRRGDYVANSNTNKVHGTCDPDYYHSCITAIAERVKQPHFFVFSDDIQWVKDTIPINYPHTYVDHNKDKNYEDLRLMSLCSHHIIANSTFSWWGAWLDKNPDKIVIAPKRWFADSRFNTKDLLPSQWVKI